MNPQDLQYLSHGFNFGEGQATEGETVPVTLFVNRGISDVHAGLNPGGSYFAQPDGSVSTDATDVLLGVAISPTEMLFLP